MAPSKAKQGTIPAVNQTHLGQFVKRPDGSKPIFRQTTLASSFSSSVGLRSSKFEESGESGDSGDSVETTTPPSSPATKHVGRVSASTSSTELSPAKLSSNGVSTDLFPGYVKEEVNSGNNSPITGSTGGKDTSSEPKSRRSPSRSASPKAKAKRQRKIKDDDLESSEEIIQEIELANQDIVTQQSWKQNAPVPYASLCFTFEKIEATTKRLEIISFCASFLLEVLRLTPKSLLPVIYLLINRLGPDYEGLEIGLGESILMKAIGECTGRSPAQLKADYRETGDLGTVAKESRSAQKTMFKPKPLTVEAVFSNLREIAATTGALSQSRKIGIINRMLAACETGNEAKFLIRSLEGKLRIRLAEKTVITALAQALITREAEKSKKKLTAQHVAEAEAVLKEVYSQVPSYDLIVPAAVEYGIIELPNWVKLTPGVPLKPMLAKPTKSITEVLDRFNEEKFTCEYKYDGERAQIHYIAAEDGQNPTCKVYSRNSEDMSTRYPDILASIPQFVKEGTKSFILDCEAVAWDRSTKRILPFQVLSTRKRKDVDEGTIKVRVCVFAFDLLYVNGRSLLQVPLQERREILHDKFAEVEGEFSYATYRDLSNVDEIQEFLDQSVKDSCEGLMIKMLDGEESGYEPSKRSRNWLKLKKDYLTGLGDSLDLVVIGGFYGRGKRTNWYGAFLLACYNPDTQEYESICKIGTGFSEEMLEKLYKQLSTTVMKSARAYYSCVTSGPVAPDVWFEPTMVWEVLAADLSMSPVYRAAMNELGRNRGVSLRFPRFIRIREDKGVEDATTSSQVAEFYENQASASTGGVEEVDED
ncbi:ATP-dependent DNA ligase [Lipomyces oligophaga]|uniref:ATP-dependent DNA ligase n=1 Tax=Lipomyces oligophaga TaxID=45792 RepID=UPI0034CFFB0D